MLALIGPAKKRALNQAAAMADTSHDLLSIRLDSNRAVTNVGQYTSHGLKAVKLAGIGEPPS